MEIKLDYKNTSNKIVSDPYNNKVCNDFKSCIYQLKPYLKTFSISAKFYSDSNWNFNLYIKYTNKIEITLKNFFHKS